MKNKRLAVFFLLIFNELFVKQAIANESFIQSIVGSGCSSFCIIDQCTNTCNDEWVSSDSNSGQEKSEKIKLSGFDTIMANNLNLNLYKSNEFKIEVISIDSTKPKLNVRQNESTLIISPVVTNGFNNRLDVSIGMPALKMLKKSGTGDLSLKEFIQATMKLDMSGTGKLMGTRNRVENLNVNLTGTVDFDLTQSQVRNVVVSASGVNKILLNFPKNEGYLAGKIEGINTLSYCGSPIDELKKFGISKRLKIECL